MLRYIAPERGILVTIYLTNNRSVTLAQREFRRRFPGRPTHTGETLRLAQQEMLPGVADPGVAILQRILLL